MEREVAPRRIVEEGVERGYGGGVEEVPGKGERRRGIVKGCVDCHREESCKKGGEGEYDEGERSKRKGVISGGYNEIGSEESVLSEEVGNKAKAWEQQEGGEGNAIEYAEGDEGTK